MCVCINVDTICSGYSSVTDLISHTNNVTFPCWGAYDITVQGNISNHAFVLKSHFSAESKSVCIVEHPVEYLLTAMCHILYLSV